MIHLMINRIYYLKKYLILLFSSLLVLMSFSINIIHAEDDTYVESPWVYRLDGNTVTIISYIGSEEVCEVPWTLGGKEIKRIESIQNNNVRKIIIPNNDVELSLDVSHNYEVIHYNLNGELLDEEESEPSEDESGSTFFDFISKSSDSKEENNEENAKTNEGSNIANNKNNNIKKQKKDNQSTDEPFREREDNPFDDEESNNSITSNSNLSNNILSFSKGSKSSFPFIPIICFAGVIIIIYFAYKKYKEIINSPSASRNFKRIKRKIMNKFR